ncbi:DUF302 domain-containing protein [Halobiforma nitratireducens]|uniref:DUF302 domain-containing protein n=1 Tax=Halobiforma nitratireducens JCM 10879 TaxID=1227454 RepID=M0LRU5_9EURY|nr:DUF302 domain-containing protein [Halobiforma nitratireducens]EMA36302.1 hypothetical protein C446_11982 [Halobiforma nitratireducens JCM 10879]
MTGSRESTEADVPAPTAEEALHTTLEMPFEDAVPFVQLEHELADFETVQVTRLDRMIEGMLGENVERTALLVMCHPEIARDAITIDHSLAGMLPCTTAVYETEDDDAVHVYHISATKAIRDLGCAPENTDDVDDLVAKTGELMTDVWENIEANADAARNC